jgi:hypothetical protein
MAPEETLSARSDIYALGAILRDLIAGCGTRSAMSSIIEKAMAGRAEDRYASALELRDEVGRYLAGERVASHRETWLEKATRLFVRHRVAILLVAAYLAMRILLLLTLHR